MRLGLPGDGEDDDDLDGDLDGNVVPAPEGIAVTTRYHPLMFGYALCTPNILVDGRPVPVVGWGRVIIPAAPGQHHLQIDIPLFGTRRLGAADCAVTVTAGTFTELEYRAPRGGSAPGRIGPRNSG